MSTQYTIDNTAVNVTTRSVKRGVETARLSVKAMAVLQALVGARGRAVSREALLDAGWKGQLVSDEVLTQAMAELRRAFGDDFRHPRIFQTVHKYGYRLIPAVEQTAAEGIPTFGDSGFTVEAYSDFLHAMELFEYDDHQKIQTALALLEGVVESCPGHVPSHAYLSILRMFIALYYGGGPAYSRTALEDAHRAIELDRQSPEALTALAFAQSISGDHRQALQHFAAAIAADSRNAEAHKLLGRVLFVLQDYRRAALMLGRVSRLLRGNYHSQMLAAKAHLGAGRPEEAIACLRAGLDELEHHPEMQRNGLQARGDRIYFQLALGNIPDALERLDQMGGAEDRQLFYPATGLARAGLLSESIDCLERCVNAGWSHYEWLESDPDLQALQSQPRFKKLKSDVRGMLA